MLVKMEKKYNLFVYGTLKRGKYNNYYLLKQKFVGGGELEGYKKLEINLPAIIKDEKGISSVKGEVFEISEECLRIIDKLEGHPIVYMRKKRQIIMENKKKIWAFVYVYRDERRF